MKSEKKYLAAIPREYKTMLYELADYTFYYTIRIWKDRYGSDLYVPFLQLLCKMFHCDGNIIMRVVADMASLPENFKHDVRHAAFVMYAMNVPIKTISWTLHIKPATLRIWVRQQMNNYPEIKKLFTDEQTSEIIKLLTAWSELKGAYV